MAHDRANILSTVTLTVLVWILTSEVMTVGPHPGPVLTVDSSFALVT